MSPNMSPKTKLAHSHHRDSLHGLAEARLREARLEILHARAPMRGRTPAIVRQALRAPTNDNPCHGSETALRPSVLLAQGDILLERLADAPEAPAPEDAQEAVIAHGELSGHRHIAHGRVHFAYQPSQAREIPDGLYLGHLYVKSAPASLEHDEHGPIALSPGTYRVRRQRRLDPSETLAVTD
jgi:hypothetical protein